MDELGSENGIDLRKGEKSVVNLRDQIDTDDHKEEREIYLPHHPLREGENLVVDQSAYKMYHPLNLPCSCLSFDLFHYLGSSIKEYPLEIYMAAGTQACKGEQNYIWVLKCQNLNRTDLDDEDDEIANSTPVVKSYAIPCSGCINRVKVLPHPEVNVVAAWSEEGVVNIYNLPRDLDSATSSGSIGNEHLLTNIDLNGVEGYALSWSDGTPDLLALGNIKGDIKVVRGLSIFEKRNLSMIDLEGHSRSVEDIKWSPVEKDVFISASSDGTIRVWDLRAQKTPQLCIMAHNSDVNVVDWNKASEYLVASGADTGEFRIWDIRTWASSCDERPSTILHTPALEFKWHRKAITSIEWLPGDSSTLAVSGEDNQVSIWDLLAYEEDTDITTTANLNQKGEESEIPPQLLFIHQGQEEIKEIHWHQRLRGVLTSTASNGIDILETVNSDV